MSEVYSVKRFRRGFAAFLTGRVAQAAARAVLLLLLVRLLVPADYGFYMLLIGLSEMLLELAGLGLLPAAQRFIPQLVERVGHARLRRFVLAIAGLQMLVVVAVATAIRLNWTAITSLFDFSPEAAAATLLGTWLFLVVPAFRFAADILECLLEQGRAQLCRALLPTLRVIALLVLLAVGHQIVLADLFLLDLVIVGSCTLLAWGFIFGALKRHASDRDEPLPVADIARHAWQMAPVGLLGAARSPGALRLIVASVLGLPAAGLFAFLQSLERLVSRYLPGVLLRGLVRPMLISRYLESGIAFVSSGFNLLSKSNVLIVAAAIASAALVGDEAVALLSGNRFEAAGATLTLMLLVMLFTSQRTLIEMVFQVTNRANILRSTALIAPVVLALAWSLAAFGLPAIIVAIGVGALLTNGLALWLYQRGEERLTVHWAGYLRIGAAAVLAFAVSYGLHSVALDNGLPLPPWARLAVLGVTYLLLLTLFKPYRANELRLVERAAGGRIAAMASIWSAPAPAKP
ncbi:MAG: hypothetical protein AAGI15_05720 [Pseudomonadota bacterium]